MLWPYLVRLAGIDPVREGHLGAIWLGWPAEPMPPAPARLPVATRTTWVSL